MAARGESAICPFGIDVPDEALSDLRRRIAATRANQSQGVQLVTAQKLARFGRSNTIGANAR